MTDAMRLADNVLAYPDEISDYLATLEGLNGFDLLVVPAWARGRASPTGGRMPRENPHDRTKPTHRR